MSQQHDIELASIIRKLIPIDFALDDLFWRETTDKQIISSVNCNDIFWWATSDAEDITIHNVDDLVKAYSDCEAAKEGTQFGWAETLFAARQRKMRPQRPVYKEMPEELKPLFDACGPERDPKEEG